MHLSIYLPTGPRFLLHVYLLFSHASLINTFKHVKDALYVILRFFYCLGFLSIEQILFVIYLSIHLSIYIIYTNLSIYISIYLSILSMCLCACFCGIPSAVLRREDLWYEVPLLFFTKNNFCCQIYFCINYKSLNLWIFLYFF